MKLLKFILVVLLPLCINAYIEADLPVTPHPDPRYRGLALIGYLYIEENGNCERDSNEKGYTGITVSLLDSNKDPAVDFLRDAVPPSTTDANGRYLFENLHVGDYYIQLSGRLSGIYPISTLIGPITVARPGTPTEPNTGIQTPYHVSAGTQPIFQRGTEFSGGYVYTDKNLNNVYEPDTDSPIQGVKVTVYIPGTSTVLASNTTAYDGSWMVSGLWPGMNYRIDFQQPTNTTSTGSSPTRFFSGGQKDVNFGVISSVDSDAFGSKYPTGFITTCFVRGPHNSAYLRSPTVVYFSANATGDSFTAQGKDFASKMSTHNYTGCVYGVAYRPDTRDTFVSAYMKAESGLGPSGTGGIYRINSDHETTLYADINKIFNDPVYCGKNTHTARVSNSDNSDSIAVRESISKVAFGEMTSTKTHLFVSNLDKREILQIPLLETPTANNIIKHKVPNPGCKVDSDWYVFAVTFYQNQLYVGGSCSGIGGSELDSFILKQNPGTTNGWTTILKFSMNYPRGCFRRDIGCGYNQWTVWDTFKPRITSSAILANLQFDENGNIAIGILDRIGEFTELLGAPDMLMACKNPFGEYKLESGGKCGDLTGAFPGNFTSLDKRSIGIDGGHFYDVQDIGAVRLHDYTSAYGITDAGPGMVIATGMDYKRLPVGSVRWFSTTNGTIIKGYNIYNQRLNPSTFDKTNGLGDLVPIYPPKLLEYSCGRIWNDTNGDGIQNCGESGISNVTVYLTNKGDAQNPITSVISDKDGYYCFEIQPNTQYSCVIHADVLSTKIGKFDLSPKQNNTQLYPIDSDADKVGLDLVSDFKSESHPGYSFDHCGFGIKSQSHS
eukprot:gene3686-4591_t